MHFRRCCSSCDCRPCCGGCVRLRCPGLLQFSHPTIVPIVTRLMISSALPRMVRPRTHMLASDMTTHRQACNDSCMWLWLTRHGEVCRPVARLVAEGPDDDAGVVAVAADHAGAPVQNGRRPRRRPGRHHLPFGNGSCNQYSDTYSDAFPPARQAKLAADRTCGACRQSNMKAQAELPEDGIVEGTRTGWECASHHCCPLAGADLQQQ